MYKRIVLSLLVLLVGGSVGWVIATRDAAEQFRAELFASNAIEFQYDFWVISVLQREGHTLTKLERVTKPFF